MVKRRRNHQRVTKHNRKCSNFKLILSKLRKLKRPQQVQAIRLANDSFIREFCSHVKKLRYAKMPMVTANKLKRRSKALQILINKKSAIQRKRKILTQRGGGIIAPLIAAFLPTIIGAITSRFRRK